MGDHVPVHEVVGVEGEEVAPAPGAELAPDQEDEKSLGVDYATLDQILIAYVEEGKDVAAIVAESGLSRDLVDYVIARTDANAFKRALEPPYPDAPFYGAPASR